ncbi:MAG: sugar phosphate isomerase/epimerase family protein [Lachnospirales bacterium]
MRKGLIGIQMMMLLSKVKKIGPYETLKKCAEMGFRCIELSQIEMSKANVSEIKRACNEFGIKVAAMSAGVEPATADAKGEFLSTDFNKIVADCKTLNCSLLRIGMMPISCMGDKNKVLEFVEKADFYGERLKNEGIELYYHNHHVEFIQYDGKYLLDIIRDNTKNLGFEIDVHWCQRGGANPLDVIANYKGRIKLLHLKDYRIGEIQLDSEGKFVQGFNDIVQFAEVGEGTLPMKKIIDLGLECGSEYFLIEQDNTYSRDPFDSLQISKNNLIKLGYADWF